VSAIECEGVTRAFQAGMAASACYASPLASADIDNPGIGKLSFPSWLWERVDLNSENDSVLPFGRDGGIAYGLRDSD
jgi:hypothetical protein